MALQTSGSLSLGDIRGELGRAAQIPFQLNSVESGSYVPLNMMSLQKPNMAQPNLVSEWYGYNHSTATACALGEANGVTYTYRQMGVFTMTSASGTLAITLTATFSGDPVDFYILYPPSADWSTATLLTTTSTTTTVYYQFVYNAGLGNNIAIGILSYTQSLGASVFKISVVCPTATPGVVTNPTTNITSTDATGNGNVMSQGSSAITSRGIVLGDASIPIPDITTNLGVFNGGTGLGSFTAAISGLSSDTVYYARAFASNSTRTGYGASLPFIYLKTTLICSLNWTIENLAATRYNNGDTISLITDPTLWAAATTGAYCYVNNSSSNTAAYGLLYNRYALQDSRGIIPPGYRLIDYSDHKPCFTNGSGELKATGTTYWLSPNTGATNTTGFDARGAGYRDATGTYQAFQQEARFWTTQAGTYTGNTLLSLSYNSTLVNAAVLTSLNFGLSVRLVRI